MIDAYAKSVHAMALMNPPNLDQTSARHGDLETGQLHHFPIAPGVSRTDDILKAGLNNSKMPERGLVYSASEGQGSEPRGVYHFVEGGEQIGHHGEVRAQRSPQHLLIISGLLYVQGHVPQ